MNKEFVPYKESLELKELGFDEPCFKLWEKTMLFTILVDPSEFKKVVSERYSKAPTLSQAFRWFREKYELNYAIVKTESWFYTINGCNTQEGFKTYEEAELACLIKLIELCQNKKK